MVDFVDMAYTVVEGEAAVDLRVVLSAGSIQRAFPSFVEVEFTTLDITTEGELWDALFLRVQLSDSSLSFHVLQVCPIHAKYSIYIVVVSVGYFNVETGCNVSYEY